MKQRQVNRRTTRGAALIIALMVVALVAVIGTSMGVDYIVTVKRASNQLIGEQAYSYALAAETIAVKALRFDLLQDLQQDNERRDSLDEFWAKDVPPFQTAEGAYGGKLLDLGGRFNLNSLRNQKERMTPPSQDTNQQRIRSVNEARFVRLLVSLSDDEGEFMVAEEDAIAILQALIDWLDADNEPTGFGGAEDDYYTSIEGRPAYRAANGPMVSPSELLLLAHMTPEIYKRLLPHVTVWPMSIDDGVAKINLNTATENVLRSLNVAQGQFEVITPATREQVAPLIQQQQLEGGFPLENSYAGIFKDAGVATIDATGLGVESDFFMLDGHVTLGDVATHMQSVISRKGGQVQVIVRSSGGL